MPGTFILRPIEANLARDTELFGKMDPYCMFQIAGQTFKSTVSPHGGIHPQWQDTITMPIPLNLSQKMCHVEIRDKNILKDDSVGGFDMDLNEVQMQGKVRKWYSLYHKDKPAGDLLLEATYMDETTMGMQPGMSQQGQSMGQMGTGSMTGMTGMGTMGMGQQDPRMMHGGTTTGQMGSMGSTQGYSGTMPSTQMGSMGMRQDPTMSGGMTTGQMGSMGMGQQDPRMMPGGMTTGQMGSMQGYQGTMPSGQMGTMGMNQDPMMQGGTTGQMGSMGPTMQSGTEMGGKYMSGMGQNDPMSHQAYKRE